MNCPSCQFVLPDDKATECPFCHAPLGKGAAPAAAPPAAAPPPAAELLPPLPAFAPPAGQAAPPPLPGATPTPAPRHLPGFTPTPAPRPIAPPSAAQPPTPAAAPPAAAPRAFELPAAAPPPVPNLITPPPQALGAGKAGPPPGPAPMEVGIPGIAFPGSPGTPPPAMAEPGAPASAPLTPALGAAADPFSQSPLPAAGLDPLDPLAIPPPAEAPRPSRPAGPPPSDVPRAKPGEIEWEPAPPPEKSPFGNFLVVGVLGGILLLWQGYRSGMISLDMIPGMSKPAEPGPEPVMKPPTPPPSLEPPPQTPPPQQPQPGTPPAPTQTQAQPPVPVPVAPQPEEEPEEPARPRERWVFEGKLYDMLTLRPVFGAQLKLEAEGEKPVVAETDERGRYRLEPPALAGGSYSLAIIHQDYDGKKYFDEISPPYRDLDQAERRMLRRVVPRHKPWAGKVGGKVKRDLVIFPASQRITETTPEPSGEGEAPPEGE